MQYTYNDQLEWLETDGLGGFASGTAGGIRTRRYHGLLTVSLKPPTNRYMLVNGLEVFATSHGQKYAITSQRYAGEVVHPEGYKLVRRFCIDPWPRWQFVLPDGVVIEHELFMRQDSPLVAIRWRAADVVAAKAAGLTLSVRPLMSGRDYHALHHENPAFNFAAAQAIGGQSVRWQPYAPLPAIIAHSNGRYLHEPLWYRNFFYREESLRGFEATEDLGSPGSFTFEMARDEGNAVLILAAHGDRPANVAAGTALSAFEALRAAELHRRESLGSQLHQSADQYIVRRGAGKSIIAGYPWFADWGRDTFVSLRGLCLATGRLEDARQILLAWAPHVSQGMLPNRFPDTGEEPEYNSVDASLWYAVAVFEFLTAAARRRTFVSESARRELLAAVEAILEGYARGTRHGIALDERDGLLRAGAPGVQLTWMDARVGDRVITPRIGKPVEVQALWLNVLHLASQALGNKTVAELFAHGRMSFRRKFWNESTRSLFDVIDGDHEPGRNDPAFRPNQIFAVGGLPIDLLDTEQARLVVDSVEKYLWTPLGLRSLAPDELAYRDRYIGSPAERDAVYHQGTVWPWLIGAFVEGWIRVRGSTKQSKLEARQRFLAPLRSHIDQAGIGHVSEIADGGAPHMPRGCPFQAWSLAEMLRLENEALTIEQTADDPRSRASRLREPAAVLQ